MDTGNRTKDKLRSLYRYAVWHDYLLIIWILLKRQPHVKKAIEFSLSLQTEDGDIRWAAVTDTTRVDDALVTGCCSIFKSLNSSLKLLG